MIVDRIRKLCKDKGINVSKLERDLGFANGSIVKTNENTQSARLKAIADYFDVSLDFLLTGKDTEKKSTTGESYYFDDATARLAQDLYYNNDLQLLIEVARKSTPDNLIMAAELLRRLNGENNG